jgi:hypothetical protein
MGINYVAYHSPEDMTKVERIAADMLSNGWTGAPIVVEGEQALTGAHRLAAAQIADIEVEAVELRDLFADADLDLDEIARDANYDLVEIVNALPASVKAEYGIDLH